MSLFSNDVRVANTATPSFGTNVNVGQMGWTQVDKSNYNQLIQYVNLCEELYSKMNDQLAVVNEVNDKIFAIVPRLNDAIAASDRVTLQAGQVDLDTKTVQSVRVEVYGIKTQFDNEYGKFLVHTRPLVENIPLEGSWTNLGSGYGHARMIKIGDTVHLEGVIHTTNTADTLVGTLKADFRPKTSKIIPLTCGGGFVAAEINTDGMLAIRSTEVSPGANPTTWLSLECSFTTT